MRRPFIFTSLGVVRGESKRGNRKCGLENDFVLYLQDYLMHEGDNIRATDRHCRQMRRKNIFGTKKYDLAKTSGEKKISP